MTAEEKISNPEPIVSTPKGTTISYIIKAMKDVCIPFKKASTQPDLIFPLNENKLTQILVEQLEVKIKSHPFIGVKNQYSDLFFNTKGIPDFYFHIVEEGVVHEPLFVVESKRLPSQTFVTEYVKGETNNGGIERFKTEKHGKGLSECGMIGFIEEENFSYWKTSINGWIRDLSQSDNNWKKDEVLTEEEVKSEYRYLKSVAHTISSGNVILHHLWIK